MIARVRGLFACSVPQPLNRGRPAVRYYVNPFCGATVESWQLAVQNLADVFESDSVDFRVVPVRLGNEDYESLALEEIRCQAASRGEYAGLRTVMAEISAAAKDGPGPEFPYSWKTRPSGSDCAELARFSSEVDDSKLEAKKAGVRFTPTLTLDGREISAFDEADIRREIAAAGDSVAK